MKKSFLKNPAYLGIALLLVSVAIGVALVISYAHKERERDLQNWQVRLGILADVRFQAVDHWIEKQFGSLRELADNGSMQLYLTQLSARPADDAMTVEPAQLSYLRNMILATAEREGFMDKVDTAPIRANIIRTKSNGLALLDQNGKIIVSTGDLQLDQETQQAAKKVLQTKTRTIRDIYLDNANRPVMAFLVPVYPLQSMSNLTPPIGVLVGLKDVSNELYPLLARQLRTNESEETTLVRRDNDSVIYLTPLADGSAPLKKRLALSTPHLGSALALQKPGSFAQMQDYRGTPVLMTSRAFSQTPWVLIHKIDAKEALKESNAHQKFLLTSFLLATFLIAASLIAAWRHGSSVREHLNAEQLMLKSKQLQSQTALLHSITDNINDFIFIVDENKNITFANQSLARAIGLKPEDMPGKTLSSMLGANVAGQISQLTDTIWNNEKPHSLTHTLEIGGKTRTYHSSALLLYAPPHALKTVLIVSHDITSLQEAQAKRDQLMRKVLKTLMRAVDLHDPFSANHSARTTQVALALGQQMQLGKNDLDALEMASNLANIGKLSVPKEILTKTEALTDDEQRILKDVTQHSVDILSGLEFEGPVLPTIEHRDEHIDGSGFPKGLRGDDIPLTSKILAVANAFVAMVSSRAYREGLSVDKALDILLTETKTKYDRHVVAALFHVAENRTDWIEWRAPNGQ